MEKNSGKSAVKIILIVSICVLVVALVGTAFFLANPDSGLFEQTAGKEYIVDDFRMAEGLKLNGIDVSNKTANEARELLLKDAEQKIAQAKITVNVNGESCELAAQDIGITTDVDQVIEQAVKFGMSGTFEERRNKLNEAAEGRAEINTKYVYNKDKAALELEKAMFQYNVPAKNASVQFNSGGTEKFTFVNEVTGVDVDIQGLASLIQTEVENQTFNAIEAPTVVTEPEITVSMLQQNTSLMGEYSTKDLGSSNRVHNITKMAGIINGVCILPGETISLNGLSGPRTAGGGWKLAHAIVGGRFDDQPGGGVCQVSGTLYNAAIRAELEIVERTPHTIPSTYVPRGLDATINTGGQDLKIKNPYEYPVYIEAHVSGDKLYVSIYGPKMDYVLKFESKQTSTIAQPAAKIVNATKTPDGKDVPPGKDVTWVAGRSGGVYAVTKIYLDLNGNEIKRESFGTTKYNAIRDEIYRNPNAAPETTPPVTSVTPTPPTPTPPTPTPPTPTPPTPTPPDPGDGNP